MCLANIAAGQAHHCMVIFKDEVLIKKLLDLVAGENQEVDRCNNLDQA